MTKQGYLQCKDIPDQPILQFCKTIGGLGAVGFIGYPNSVSNAMPKEVTPRLVQKKMKTLVNKGLIRGCTCGCRGDYELTWKGEQLLNLLGT